MRKKLRGINGGVSQKTINGVEKGTRTQKKKKNVKQLTAIMDVLTDR